MINGNLVISETSFETIFGFFNIKFKDNEKYMKYEYEHSKQYFIYSGTDGF